MSRVPQSAWQEAILEAAEAPVWWQGIIIDPLLCYAHQHEQGA